LGLVVVIPSIFLTATIVFLILSFIIITKWKLVLLCAHVRFKQCLLCRTDVVSVLIVNSLLFFHNWFEQCLHRCSHILSILILVLGF